MTSRDEITGRKIKDLRERVLREGQTVFGERFGVSQAAVSRWEKGSPVTGKLRQQIADLAGVSIAEFFYSESGVRHIPIVGYVSGGEAFSPIEDHEPGAGLDFVSPKLTEEDYIAVMIRGDSMTPVYRNGDLIIAKRMGRRDLLAVIGRDCIVKTSSGEGYIKRVLAGTKKGAFRLRSYNVAYDDIEDVQIEWAAPVAWIRRGE